MKNVFFVLLTLIILFSGCENNMKRDLQQSIQQIRAEKENLPEPKFDKSLEAILKDYKEKYQAEGVRIGRPYMYSSEGDSSYWLKVELLNPEFGDKKFKEFGEEVAVNTLSHLINGSDFEKIEVSVTQKKGFIISFSSSQTAYYYRDSLQARYNR